MLGAAANYQFTNTLQNITREGFITKKVIDIFFNKSNKGFNYLRQKGMVDDVIGDAALMWPVNTQGSPNTVAFDGDDPLPTNSNNTNIVRAGVDWKRYADALVLNLVDIADNEGSPEAIASLVDSQLDITKMSLVNTISDDWINNTLAANAKRLSGLADGVDDGTVTTTYANLSRSNAQYGSLWKSTTSYSIASTANLLNSLHSTDLKASIDGQRPDFYMCNTLLFGQLVESLTAQDRYMQPDMARAAGGTDLIFNGNPLFIDHHVPTGVNSPAGSPSGTGGIFYGLNSSYIKLVVHPKYNFVVQDWKEAQGNATLFTRVFWFGALAILKPSSHFVAWVQGA